MFCANTIWTSKIRGETSNHRENVEYFERSKGCGWDDAAREPMGGRGGAGNFEMVSTGCWMLS